ncbi:MAG: hypothetical protein HW400_568 [Candidatus Levybacteria bacterium]|nr:hypothetical protein [Candidatus Levybacteria bacterium]
MNDLQLFKQRFDIYLEKYLDRKIKNISKFTNNSSILNYISYLKKNSLSGGKRIRPYLAYLMYKALGEKKEEQTLKFLVSLEIFHTFCLVHDDIMDKSGLRHGIPTAHTYITDMLKQEKRIGDLSHVGNSQAILLGDILLTWSQKIINSDKYFSQEIMKQVRAYFYEMVDEVSVGQMIDVDMVTRKKVSKELIDEKTKLKTAGYSFTKPLLIGAALSGKNTKEVEKFCKAFGLAIGIAFQTQDDLLDVISSDNKLGKTTSLDKSQNQHTYFTYFPSLVYGKKIISKNFKQARNLIKNSTFNESGKMKFFDLVDLVQKRTS